MTVHKDTGAECPIARTVSLIGKKWTLLILKELCCDAESVRFNGLKRNLKGITSAILSKRLREMEDEGIISRKVKTAKPPLCVEYSLTAKGQGLHEVMQRLKEWGQQWGQDGAHKILSCEACKQVKAGQ